MVNFSRGVLLLFLREPAGRLGRPAEFCEKYCKKLHKNREKFEQKFAKNFEKIRKKNSMKHEIKVEKERTCLTCKHWKRHADPVIGSCQLSELGGVFGLRFQHELCDINAYAPGESRIAAFTNDTEDPFFDNRGRLRVKRAAEYYGLKAEVN